MLCQWIVLISIHAAVVPPDAEKDLRDAIYQELIETMKQTPDAVPQCVSLMFVARNLERIADHATNIAEDVLYLVKGIDVRHHAETRP